MKAEYKITLPDRAVYFRADVLNDPTPTASISPKLGSWKPMEIIFRDNKEAAKMIMRQSERQREDKDFTTSRFDITINDWLLEGCLMTSYEFADRDVTDKTSINISVSIRPTNVTRITE
jgi:hypothetical protein